MATPRHTFKIHASNDWMLTFPAPTIDGSTIDMEAAEFGDIEVEILADEDDSTAVATCSTTESANGSVITVAPGGASASMFFAKADLADVEIGNNHYNMRLTWDGETRTFLHGPLVKEG